MDKCIRSALLLILSTILLSGCEEFHETLHGTSDDDTTNSGFKGSISARQAAAIETDSFKVFLPEGIVATDVEEAINAAFVFGGPELNATALNDVSLREVAGFIAQWPETEGGYASALALLQQIAGQIGALENAQLSNTETTQNNQDTLATGRYSLSLDAEQTITELNNLVAQRILLVNVDPASVALPVAQSNDAMASDYQFSLTVFINDANEAAVITSLVPEDVVNDYLERLNNLGNTTNIGAPGDLLTQSNEQFTAPEQLNLAADFMFVIDNSGSMSDEQQALSDAATAFNKEIALSGLDYNIGIITTDSATPFTGTAFPSQAPFTDDTSIFATRVTEVGTGGSATETGIYHSELALKSLSLGDTEDGPVTLAGYPRPGASLSIIIMSDEDSQYEDSPAGGTFDPQSNLFIERGYQVYAIVDDSEEELADSQYDELALATGGSFSGILDTDNFPAIMAQIANNAGGQTSPYVLRNTPIAGSIRVLVEGVEVPNGANGWQYFSRSNTILLRGDAIPAPGASVEVAYSYIDPTTEQNTN